MHKKCEEKDAFYTAVASVASLIDAMINAQMCTKWFI